VTQIPISVFRLPHIEKTPFDPLTDLTYILGISGYTFGVVVRTEAPWKTWGEFVAFAKANPNKISYGTPGANTNPHITMEEIALKQGLKWEHVPHKGNAPAIVALLGGHIDSVADSTGWGPHVQAGKVRLLVTWGESRTKRWPEVPTLKELGFGIVSNSPYGLAGPKGMDPRTVKALHDAFKKGAEDPIHLAALERYDQDLWYASTEDYARFSRDTFVAEKARMDWMKALSK
jgi:tripartite-type tricarboxylate transporter receptor subunit TctC